MSLKTIVVKIGGSTLGSGDTTIEDLVSLQKRGTLPVVVHGGGKKITEWLDKQGIPSKFEKGLRVTDAQSLEVVIAVLAGLVNKELVAAIESLGGRAIGLSGIDGGLIEATPIHGGELGYVGEVTRINPEPLRAILEPGYIPIIAPVGLQSSGEGILNINADTVAGEIAAELGASRLIFLTDVAGVCDESGRLIPQVSPTEARALIASGVASGGMIPKIEACLRALSAVSSAQIIDGRQPHALLAAVKGRGEGTQIG